MSINECAHIYMHRSLSVVVERDDLAHARPDDAGVFRRPVFFKGARDDELFVVQWVSGVSDIRYPLWHVCLEGDNIRLKFCSTERKKREKKKKQVNLLHNLEHLVGHDSQ